MPNVVAPSADKGKIARERERERERGRKYYELSQENCLPLMRIIKC